MLCVTGSTLADKPRFDQHRDPLPDGAIARFGTTRYRIGAVRDIDAAAISSDGKTLAVATPNEVSVWDVDSGRCISRFEPSDSPSQMGFTSDGQHLVGKNNMQMWIADPATGKERFASTLQHVGGSLVLFPNSTRFAVCHSERVYVHNVTNGELEDIQEPGVSITALGPSGRYFVAWSDGNAMLIDANTGLTRCRFSVPQDMAEFKSALTSDDLRFCILTKDGRLQVFDALTGKKTEDLKPPAGWEEDCYSFHLTLSPDGAIAYISQGIGLIYRRHLGDRKWLDPIKGAADGPILAHPDGKQIIVPGGDGVIRRYDVRSLTEIVQLHGFDEAPLLAPSPNGKYIATTSGWNKSRIELFELSGRLRWSVSHPGWTGPPRWSPDGRLIAYAGESHAVVVDAAPGKTLHMLQSPDPEQKLTGLLGFAHDHSRLFASANNGDVVAAFDLRTHKAVTSFRPEMKWATDISPDGRTMSFSNGSVSIALFDLETGRGRVGFIFPAPLRRGCGGWGIIRHTGGFVQFSPDG
jgi:WD40 repeat protein